MDSPRPASEQCVDVAQSDLLALQACEKRLADIHSRWAAECFRRNGSLDEFRCLAVLPCAFIVKLEQDLWLGQPQLATAEELK